MKVEESVQVESASRMGKRTAGAGTPWAVLVKLKNPTVKSTIFKCAKNLKDTRNSKDGRYYINNQLPPRLQEQHRCYHRLIRFNASIARVGKRDMKIKNGELLIDGVYLHTTSTTTSGG